MKKMFIVFLLLLFTCTITVKAEELTEGSNIKTYLMTKGSNNMNTKKVLMINENEYIVAGGITKNIIQYQSEYDCVGYLAYYKNNYLMWQKTFDDFGQGIINDVCFHDDLIGAIFTIDKNNVRNVMIVEFSIEGEMVNLKDLSASRDTYARSINYYNGYYYFVCQTYAKDGSFYRYGTNNYIVVVGQIKADTLTEMTTTFIGNSLNNYLSSCIMINDTIYLCMQFNGSGYFSCTSGSESYWALVSVNERCEYINHIEFNYAEEGSVWLSGGNELIVASKEYGKNDILFQNYNKDLELKSFYKESISERYNNIAIGFNKNNNNVLLMYEKDKKVTMNYYGNNYALLYHGEIILSNKIENITNCFYKDGAIYFAGNNYVDNKQTPFLIRYVDTVCTSDNEVYFTGTKANKNYANEEIYMEYGEYEIKYNYILNNLIFNRIEEYKVDLDINIMDKMTYDVGVNLLFNCDAYLNNKEIKSGYTIDKTGVYVLELIGNNTSVTYTFTIDNISLKNISKQEKNKFNVVIDNKEVVSNNNTEVISLSKNNTNNSIINGGIYISLIIAIIGLSFGLFIPIKGKRHV